MPKQTKVCRVCGASYEACRSIKTGDIVFNWREVACSPECGKIYLQRVMASRGSNQVSGDNGEQATHVPRRRKAERSEAEVQSVEE